MGLSKVIIFLGNHVPIITPIELKLREIIHYMGCYHADGTKVGPGWSINASTPAQAKYYINKYRAFVSNSSLVYDLTYTKHSTLNESTLKTKLANKWKQATNIVLDSKRIYINEGIIVHTDLSQSSIKYNVLGSLRIRDNRGLVSLLYNKLLRYMHIFLQRSKEKDYIWQFLLGLLEGDGYVAGGKNRFGIGFSSSIETNIIQRLLDKLDITYSVDKSLVNRNEGLGINITIWLVEILLNLDQLIGQVFKFYSKRRKKFLKRLVNQSSIKYLLENKKFCFPLSSSLLIQERLNAESLANTIQKWVLKESKIKS